MAQTSAAESEGGGGSSGIITYDTPNLWVDSAHGSCDDSRAKASVTESLPWCTFARAVWGSTNRASPNASEAATGGDVVQVAAGTYTVAGQGSSEISYRPAGTGTEGNPIVFQAEEGATVTLNLSSPGSAIGGFAGDDWVTWRGFTLDDVNNPQFIADGVVHVEGADGITLEDLKIYGRDDDTKDGDQYCGIVGYDVGDFTIRGNLVDGFGGGLDGSGLADSDENATAVTLFWRQANTVIEHNEFRNLGAGIYAKGIRQGGGPPWETGPITIRYNNIHTNKRGILQYVMPMSASNLGLIYQNVIRDNSFYGIFTQWFGSPDGDAGGQNESKYIKFINNTLYHNGYETEGAQIKMSQYPANVFIELRNNVVAGTSTLGYMNFGTDINTNATDLDRNLVNGFTSSFAHTVGDATDHDLGEWQTLTDQDANTITSAPTFTNAAGNDFTLVSNGQAALTLGQVVFSICGTNGATIQAGAHCDGSTIGRGN